MVWLTAFLGLAILLLAGDLLVRGAVNLSLRFGVPALLVSLTIVAFGTSAPELLISVDAVLRDAPGLALGNVVGSNTANVLLVLGLPALLAGSFATGASETRKSFVTMIAASVLFIGIACLGAIGRLDGLILLGALALVLGDQAREALGARKRVNATDDVEAADPNLAGWKIAVYLILGLIGLPLGADLLVESSLEIAKRFGVPDTVIGLTLVAVGTSLPELATTTMAAFRRQADVALGNVIGSNVFNLLAIIGIASLFGNIPVDPSFLRFDLWAMLAASLLLAPFVFTSTRDMTRRWGALFCGLYAAYLATVVVLA